MPGSDVLRLAMSLPVANQIFGGASRGAVDLIRRAEEAGVDTAVVVDHVVMGNRLAATRGAPTPFPRTRRGWSRSRCSPRARPSPAGSGSRRES